MAKKPGIWLLAGVGLLLAGVGLVLGVMAANGWDFSILSTANYVTREHTLSESFTNISVKTDTASVILVPTEETTTRVVCVEQEKEPHSVSVENGTLTIRLQDNRKWYHYIGIQIGGPKITVYLPKGEYEALQIKVSTGAVELPTGVSFGSAEITASTGAVTSRSAVSGALKIKTSTGDIRVESCSVGSLDLSVSTGLVQVNQVTCGGNASIGVSTGDVTVKKLNCKSFASTGDTGHLRLEDVLVTEKLSVKRDTGDVSFLRCDAGEVSVKTDTGSVKGSFLTDKVFYCTTDTGRVEVPRSKQGGICEVETDTGDIRLEICD